jgi:hypothetical protein
MQKSSAVSLTSAVNDWLTNTHHPRILHVFDHACNLINEQKEILSIVTPEIGDGPFNLVIETEVLFSEHINLESSIFNSVHQLHLGDLIIHIAGAKLWNPKPDWEKLHSQSDDIAKQLRKLQITTYLKQGGLDTGFAASAQPYSTTTSLHSLHSDFSSALASADIPNAREITSKLAGLGQGLTPSGDDFLMGALHAVWILHSRDVANGLAQSVADATVPLTTSLSAAWIRSAGRGEAGVRWHEFFDALVGGNGIKLNESVERILAVGETSGADALAGFVGTINSWANDRSSVSDF